MPSQEVNPEGTPRAVFGTMLRWYRQRAGLSQDVLGARAHMSGKTISAYENGWRVPTRPATSDIDAVPELQTHGALTQLWDSLKDGMNYQAFPAWFQDWPGKEAQAVTLRSFQPLLVPGLLQTEHYARAIFQTRFGLSEDEIEARVAARMKRQETLARDRPPAFWVILDEALLSRPVGGRHVMLEQIDHLIDMARRPTIAIEIIPVSVGAHEGLTGAFTIADFADTLNIAYQEAAVGGQLIDDREDIAALELTWATLRRETLPRKASLAVLEEAAKTWTSAA
ncbi:MAG: helix-turn-helix domain-containing protein [Gemmatimonadota bacterium]